MTGPITIILVDDHEVVRNGVRAYLDSLGDFGVVGEASSGDEALGLVAELIPNYGADCPVAVVWRASWPDQRIIRATLATLAASVPAEVERTALILVGPSLAQERFEESRLYAGDYDRRYRPVGTHPRFPGTGR